MPSENFAERVEHLFSTIFAYHFTRKIVRKERKTPFGKFAAMTMRKAEEAPLAQLLKRSLVCEPDGFEVLVNKVRIGRFPIPISKQSS